MTKRDYLFLSSAIKQARDYAKAHPEQHADVGITITLTIAHALSERFGPKFNRDRFLVDCGLNP